ncbi:MAG TPA: hypothetical protein VEG39_03090 [Clostridia bacterium]|nr:hypothetical protein [Clostridia bacterium]
MGKFKLTCCQCGSINVVKKSAENKLDWAGDCPIYGEGIQFKCTDCDNEEFIIFRTRKDK